jgi:hypothetical protein
MIDLFRVSFPTEFDTDNNSEFSTRIPVRFGFPLPRGWTLELLSGYGLSSSQGWVLQSDYRPLSYWPDGTLRWVGVDVLLTREEMREGLRLREGIAGREVEGASVWGGVSVESQGLVLGGCGIGGVALQVRVRGPWGEYQGSGSELGLELRHGRLGIDFASRTTFSVGGLSGPIELSMTGSLWRDGRVDLSVCICNTNVAEHPGGNWDLGAGGAIEIEDMTLELRPLGLAVAGGAKVEQLVVCEELGGELRVAKENLRLFQASSGGKNWKSRTHMIADGTIPLRFSGYELHVDQLEIRGSRATPYVGLRYGEETFAVAMRRFWQNFPGVIRCTSQGIEMGFFPRESGYLHELQGGEQKTFEFALYQGGVVLEDRPLDGYLRFPTPVISEAYLESAGVELGAGSALCSMRGKTPSEASRLYEGLVRQAIEGSNTFFSKREVIDEYGWRNFGDVYADHEAVFHKGDTPLISHLNNQYDCALGFAIQYLRTGDKRWYEQLIDLANHAWDIDTYHTMGDKSSYNRGLFWHTYHYADASTGTHRGYPKSLLYEEVMVDGVNLDTLGATGEKLKKAYGKGGGPAASHVYSMGWMVAYYLTGDERYRKAVINSAEYVMGLEDGSTTRFRWLSNRSTGFATCSSIGYYGPGRASSNSIHALLSGYELTRDVKYLDMAVYLMKRCVHPEQDLDSMDLFNAELRWFYTMHLQAQCWLIDVLGQVPGQEANLQYAVASLLHYARWMLEHERPILDHPEQLQYPTETWAAQDIRKWHVLAYASRWCSTREEGSKMMAKAEWFYDYVMRTLDGFETKSLCRPVVLMLGCGWQRDGMVRDFEAMCPKRIELPTEWVSHALFIPQREEAIRRAKKILMVGAGGMIVLFLAVVWFVAKALLG